ncbi:hypothetical protein, partial [Shigella flexneri]|uniref:hypothetical protein n=1 Tax=Shigella flexneri TaxID=623 RepID=UPI001C0A7BC1
IPLLFIKHPRPPKNIHYPLRRHHQMFKRNRMKMEATQAPKNHHHTLNQKVGSITKKAARLFLRIYKKKAGRFT